jgi:hypothetical protein
MNAQIKETGLKLDWNSCVGLLRDVFDCLPIRCRGADSLLLNLDAVFLWAESLMGHFRPQKVHEELNATNKSGHRSSYIDEVAKAYGMSLSSRTFFLLEAHLEYRLSLYILRQQILSSPTCGVSTKKSIYASLKLSDGSHVQVDNKTVHGKTATPHDLVYCVCRLPEDDSETTTLTQCDLCGEWYHPFCINMKNPDEKRDRRTKADEPIVKKRKTRQNESFECPFCKLLSKEVSSLAFPICGEWFDSALIRKSASCNRVTLGNIIALASMTTFQELRPGLESHRDELNSIKIYPDFSFFVGLDISSTLNTQEIQPGHENILESSTVGRGRGTNRKSKLVEHAPLSLEGIRSVINRIVELPLVNVSLNLIFIFVHMLCIRGTNILIFININLHQIPISFLLQLMERYTNEWLAELASFWRNITSFLHM